MTKNDLKKRIIFHTTVNNTAMVSVAEKLGENVGLYGWNWTAYRLFSSDGKEVIILIAYRNTVGLPIPKGVEEWYNERHSHIGDYNGMKTLMSALADKLVNIWESEG